VQNVFKPTHNNKHRELNKEAKTKTKNLVKKNILEVESNRLKRKRQIQETNEREEKIGMKGREIRHERIKIRESNKRKDEFGKRKSTLTKAKGRLEWWIVKEDTREHCLHSSLVRAAAIITVRCCVSLTPSLPFATPRNSTLCLFHFFLKLSINK